MPNIRTSHERARGCGFRKKGTYIVSSGVSVACNFFPRPTVECDCCGLELRPTTSMAMRPTKAMFPKLSCIEEDQDTDMFPTSLDNTCCGLVQELRKHEHMLLDWVSASAYESPKLFIREASAMGVSRRVANVPKDIVFGETRIVLAHARAAVKDNAPYPGYFGSFVPEKVEYVIGGDESEAELQAMEDKGYELVQVYPVHDEQASLFDLDPVDGYAEYVNKAVNETVLESTRRFLEAHHRSEYEIIDRLVNDNLKNGKHARLAGRLETYMRKDLGWPSDRCSILRKYVELRIEEYKKDLEAQ